MNFSLNMVQIQTIPDSFSLSAVRKSIGWNIFSSHVVCNIVKKNCHALGVSPKEELPKALSCCLDSPNSEVKNLANQIADELGRRLALVLYTAKNTEHVHVSEQADFAKFKACNQFCLGGGLAAGRLGEEIVTSGNKALRQAGCDILLEQFAFPQYMPLIGCAALCPQGQTLVFDFGQTYLKSALVLVKNNQVQQLRIQKKEPSQYMKRQNSFAWQKRREAAHLDAYLKEYLLQPFRAQDQAGLNHTIVISCAGKAEENQLLPYGAYGKLEDVFGNYRERLETFLSAETKRPIRIILQSDEQAGALAVKGYDGLSITLGTAFGLGEPSRIKEGNFIENITVVSK